MKKVIFYIIILFMLFFSTVKAEETLNLDKKIIEFPSVENYSLQGFTVVKDNLFMVLNGYDDKVSKIIVYDLKNYNKIKEYDFGSLGHANDVTYNSKNNIIYVLAGGGSNEVYLFNGTDFLYIDKLNLELPARSITYIEDSDMYAIRTVATGFKLDNELKLKSKVPFIFGMNIKSEVGRQGWSYYNGYIYYSNWSWIRLGGDGSNIIFIYDLNGSFVDTLYTKNDIGEIEDIAFYNDTMILGFNGYNDKIMFYELNVPEIFKEESYINDNMDESYEIETDINYQMYYLSGLVIIVLVIILIIILRKKNK